MLSKQKRISRKEFNQLYSSSKNLRGSFFILKYTKNSDIFKVSIVVSKKVAKTSVERHVIKRLIYRAFEDLERSLSLKGGFICIVQKSPVNIYSLIYQELFNLLK